jgi:hypothetical protein
LTLDKNKRIENKKAIQECKKIGYCRICGKPGNDPHHIITVGSGGPDHEYNLICLCRACHRRVHDGIIKRDYLFYVQTAMFGKKIDENTIYKLMRGE